MVIEIESAVPVLDSELSKNQFIYSVNGWLVSGYEWDGECMCSKRIFKNVLLPIKDTLSASKTLLKHEYIKLNKLNKSI